MGVWYCTREDVKAALDSAQTARNNAQIDRLIEASTETIHGLTHRRFYPLVTTKYFPWPNMQHASVGRLWLDENELYSLTTLTTDGEVISPSDVFLESQAYGPPYTHIDLVQSSNAAFNSADGGQRSIAIAGVWYWLDESAGGATAEALDASETGVDVTNSAILGVGSIIRVDDERMIVTEKSMLTTGQTLQGGTLDSSNAAVTVAVTDGTTFFVGETILLNSERMLIVDIAGNNLTVKRAWDGTVLSPHTGSTIYAPRTLTVERGALGTTAATHLTATAILKHSAPPLVRQLAIAETLTGLQQEGSGYGRVVGSGDGQREASGKGLADLRDQVYTRYGRKARMRAV